MVWDGFINGAGLGALRRCLFGIGAIDGIVLGMVGIGILGIIVGSSDCYIGLLIF